MPIEHGSRFILLYLFRYEPRVYRWICIPKLDTEIMRKNRNVPEETGYEYTLPSREQLVEFMLMTARSFQLK